MRGFDLGFFEYPTHQWPTPWKKVPPVQLLAEGLHTEIENRHGGYESVVLVAHSLGGLVVRRYLADRFDIKYVVAGQDSVVDAISAKGVQGVRQDVAVLTNCDHRSCVKPTSIEDLSYTVLKNFVLQQQTPRTSPTHEAFRRLRVVGFDLDGTLLRGLTFSWTMIWEHLGYPTEVHREGMRNFLTAPGLRELRQAW
jgi:pimeloyl-ACP methyl ester carboxylesterase